MTPAPPLEPHPRLLIFDLDGTLTDSLGLIVATLEGALRDVGIPSPGAAAIRSRVGLSPVPFLEDLLPDAAASDRAQVLQRYLTAHRNVDLRDATCLFPGVRATLQALQAEGYELAVATGKSRSGLLRTLDTFDLRPLFTALRTADTTRSKPHPQMLFEILTELGRSADEALMIGDTTFDLEMAHSAGMRSVGVLSGGHDRERLESVRPLIVLEDAASLRAFLRAAERPSAG